MSRIPRRNDALGLDELFSSLIHLWLIRRSGRSPSRVRADRAARPQTAWGLGAVRVIESPTLHSRRGRNLARYRLAVRSRVGQEARKSTPERSAPAIAGVRSVRRNTARRSGLPDTPRRPRARTDHTFPSFSITCLYEARPRIYFNRRGAASDKNAREDINVCPIGQDIRPGPP